MAQSAISHESQAGRETQSTISPSLIGSHHQTDYAVIITNRIINQPPNRGSIKCKSCW